MRQFVKVILEQADGHWSAWLEQFPQRAFGGDCARVALERLLESNDGESLDTTHIIAVAESTHEGHLEFLIPLRNHFQIPVPSVN